MKRSRGTESPTESTDGNSQETHKRLKVLRTLAKKRKAALKRLEEELDGYKRTSKECFEGLQALSVNFRSLVDGLKERRNEVGLPIFLMVFVKGDRPTRINTRTAAGNLSSGAGDSGGIFPVRTWKSGTRMHDFEEQV